MLRITRIDGPTPTLRLEGKLVGPWVAEVRDSCTASGANLGVSLDLFAVTFVDAAGARMLRELLGGGVAIAACSGYVAELLHGEKS